MKTKGLTQGQLKSLSDAAKKSSVSIEDFSKRMSQCADVFKKSVEDINKSFGQLRINSLPKPKSIYHN